MFLGAIAVSLAAIAAPAFALEENSDEKKKLKTREKVLCAISLSKGASGDDLTCALSKTWATDNIKKGANTKSLSWGFGDAGCILDLKAARANLVSSLTKPGHKFEVKPYAINCLIERGDDVTKIDVTLAPKVTFNDGKPAKTDLNITKVDASTVISTVITGGA